MTDMSDKLKVRIALAEAIVTQLWVKGLITSEQREKIDEKSRIILEESE